MWDTGWQALIETWKEQLALNEGINQLLDGLQDSDAALFSMVQRME